MATTHSQHEGQNVDENGEVIIAKAVLKHSSVRNWIIWNYCLIGMLLCFIFLPCTLMIGCILGFRGSSALRIYLTSTGLHYNRVSSTGCVSKMKFIPLSDIYDVTVNESTKQDHLGTVITRRLVIRINSDKISDHISWSERTLYNVDYVILVMNNATEMCAAIKQQIQEVLEL